MTICVSWRLFATSCLIFRLFVSRKFPVFSLIFPDSRHNYGTVPSHHPEERLVFHHVPLRRSASEGQDVRRPRNASRDSLEDLHII